MKKTLFASIISDSIDEGMEEVRNELASYMRNEEIPEDKISSFSIDIKVLGCGSVSMKGFVC